ncbi:MULTISPECIES: hypothetical protein [unclassified Acidiphilium]|uniref:hypothetical protein n=1 Tax=unclassified Acidiphilium TaxID=2617493 RepID=UPI000BC69E0A|nr:MULTISPECIES: hypothetical protein [unclassified Acidiphilium]OZB22290.1 MAG: hypothetical protein B7X49_17145 [Acidiphilium sp. 34-64-41]
MDAEASPLTFRMSPLDRALDNLRHRASDGLPYFTPEAQARQYLLLRHLRNVVESDDVRDELITAEQAALRLCTEAASACVSDIRLKLAALIIEATDINDGDQIAGPLGTVLAELTILGDRPLPASDPLRAMTAADAQ